MDTAAQTPPPPLAPPTAPGQPVMTERRATWPMVIGILFIVFGAGGALMNLWGIVVNLFLSSFMLEATTPEDAEVVERISGYMPINAAFAAGSLVLSILLLATGIGVIRRRPWSVTATRWWAVLRILVSAGSLLPMALMQQAQLEANAAGGGPGMPQGMVTGIVIAIVVVGLLWSWALPIFMLVWLRLKFVRSEIATWTGTPA